MTPLQTYLTEGDDLPIKKVKSFSRIEEGKYVTVELEYEDGTKETFRELKANIESV